MTTRRTTLTTRNLPLAHLVKGTAIYFATLIVCACDQSTPLVAPKTADRTGALSAPTTPGKVSGQVFVVTEGRENIKLALVDVSAIPEPAMRDHVKQLNSAEPVTTDQLLQEFATLIEKQKKQIAQMQREGRRATQAEWRQILAERKRMKELESESSRIARGERYFHNMPKPATATKTDADGRFEMSAPPGKYVLAATANRLVGTETEQYSWLVQWDAGIAATQVLLSNDNQVETQCAQCLPLK